MVLDEATYRSQTANLTQHTDYAPLRDALDQAIAFVPKTVVKGDLDASTLSFENAHCEHSAFNISYDDDDYRVVPTRIEVTRDDLVLGQGDALCAYDVGAPVWNLDRVYSFAVSDDLLTAEVEVDGEVEISAYKI